jgi:hypothetical protein
MVAALAAFTALGSRSRWLVDVSMAAVAASVAGATLPAPPDLAVAPPRARSPAGRAAALGADTRELLEKWDRGT